MRPNFREGKSVMMWSLAAIFDSLHRLSAALGCSANTQSGSAAIFKTHFISPATPLPPLSLSPSASLPLDPLGGRVEVNLSGVSHNCFSSPVCVGEGSRARVLHWFVEEITNVQHYSPANRLLLCFAVPVETTKQTCTMIQKG